MDFGTALVSNIVMKWSTCSTSKEISLLEMRYPGYSKKSKQIPHGLGLISSSGYTALDQNWIEQKTLPCEKGAWMGEKREWCTDARGAGGITVKATRDKEPFAVKDALTMPEWTHHSLFVHSLNPNTHTQGIESCLIINSMQRQVWKMLPGCCKMASYPFVSWFISICHTQGTLSGL